MYVERKKENPHIIFKSICSVIVGAVPEGGPQMAQTLNEIKVLLQVHNIINIYIPTIK